MESCKQRWLITAGASRAIRTPDRLAAGHRAIELDVPVGRRDRYAHRDAGHRQRPCHQEVYAWCRQQGSGRVMAVDVVTMARLC